MYLHRFENSFQRFLLRPRIPPGCFSFRLDCRGSAYAALVQKRHYGSIVHLGRVIICKLLRWGRHAARFWFGVSPRCPTARHRGHPIILDGQGWATRENRRSRGSETCSPARHFGWIGTFWRILPAKTGWIYVETYLNVAL
jgi:hypothetical protein